MKNKRTHDEIYKDCFDTVLFGINMLLIDLVRLKLYEKAIKEKV